MRLPLVDVSGNDYSWVNTVLLCNVVAGSVGCRLPMHKVDFFKNTNDLQNIFCSSLNLTLGLIPIEQGLISCASGYSDWVGYHLMMLVAMIKSPYVCPL